MRVLDPVLQRAAAVTAPVAERARPVWATVTSGGRAVLGIGLLGWLLAWQLGWTELAVVATASLVLVVTAAMFMVGRTNLGVGLVVEPHRVTVGEAVTGEVEVLNRARTPLLPLRIDLPVGPGGVAFDLPGLRPGGDHRELFVVPTERRGVIAVGPVTTSRGDPLGLFRRETLWSRVTEVFVHPRIVALEPLSAGLIRDLEGNTAENVSMSDLAFHALREYTPGDDLRHIHWRSSAKHQQLLVRQFLDTRRSHLTVVVDCEQAVYRAEEDYEIAVSVAASLMVRAILDGYDATFLSGTHAMSRGAGRSALDACSRAVLDDQRLVDVAGRGARLAPDTSVVVLVTGAHAEFNTLHRSAGHFPVEVAKAAFRVDQDASPALRRAGDLPLLTLGALTDLPVLMKWGLR